MATSRTTNITTPERAVRIGIGVGLIAIGVLVLGGGPGAWGFVGAFVLLGAGLDLATTGAIGYCPLYARLGYTPKALRKVVR